MSMITSQGWGLNVLCRKHYSATSCLFQIMQELEKQRLEVLCNMLKKYNLYMSSLGQTLKHVSHRDIHHSHQYILHPNMDIITYTYFCILKGQTQIEQLVKRVDMDKDIQILEEEIRIIEENKVELLMTDYYVSL